MLSFSWNFPPELAEVRNQYTLVVLRFSEATNGTLLRFSQTGWGVGGQWDEGFAYFADAWGNWVLPRLAYRFAVGPVDWSHRPSRDELSKYRQPLAASAHVVTAMA
jgi:hypothetical protein